MMPTANQDLSGLKRQLTDVLGAEHGICSLRGPVHRLQNSRIYQAESFGKPFPLMIKHCLLPNTQTSDRETARVQYAALSRARQITSTDSRYNVPAPVALLEREGIVVMEWVKASAMTSRLLRMRGTSAERRLLVMEAAEWLRRFHRSSGVAHAGLAARAMLPRLTAEVSPILEDRVCQSGITALESTCDHVDAVDVGGGYPHGDFKSDNLLVSRERIVAIDIHYEEENSVLFDIAMFLNHLELLALQPRGLMLARERAGLTRAFLDRYFQGDTIPALAMGWTRLFVLLGAWIDLPEENPGWLRYHYMNVCFRHVAKRLTDGLKAIKA